MSRRRVSGAVGHPSVFAVAKRRSVPVGVGCRRERSRSASSRSARPSTRRGYRRRASFGSDSSVRRMPRKPPARPVVRRPSTRHCVQHRNPDPSTSRRSGMPESVPFDHDRRLVSTLGDDGDAGRNIARVHCRIAIASYSAEASGRADSRAMVTVPPPAASNRASPRKPCARAAWIRFSVAQPRLTKR